MSKHAVLLHADAGVYEGWGHLSESLEIARALRERGAECRLVLPEGVPGAFVETENLGFRATALPAEEWQSGNRPEGLIELLKNGGARYLVGDLVKIRPAYSAALAESLDSWACITELPEDEIAPINFNIAASPEYMPLRKEFRNAKTHQIRGDVGQVLICFGGSDPFNVSTRTIELLSVAAQNGNISSEVRLNVVVGPLYPYKDQLSATVLGHPLQVRILGPLSHIDLLELARESDLAITTSGGTMYEFAALGLPSVVIPISPKHVANAKVLENRSVVLRTSMYDKVTAEEIVGIMERMNPQQTRKAMSKAGQREIDGFGATRIAERLFQEWDIG